MSVISALQSELQAPTTFNKIGANLIGQNQDSAFRPYRPSSSDGSNSSGYRSDSSSGEGSPIKSSNLAALESTCHRSANQLFSQYFPEQTHSNPNGTNQFLLQVAEELKGILDDRQSWVIENIQLAKSLAEETIREIVSIQMLFLRSKVKTLLEEYIYESFMPKYFRKVEAARAVAAAARASKASLPVGNQPNIPPPGMNASAAVFVPSQPMNYHYNNMQHQMQLPAMNSWFQQPPPQFLRKQDIFDTAGSQEGSWSNFARSQNMECSKQIPNYVFWDGNPPEDNWVDVREFFYKLG